MSLKITHRDGDKVDKVDSYAVKKFDEHIVNQFKFNPSLVDAKLDITNKKRLSKAAIHFHYKRMHTHLSCESKNILNAIANVYDELETFIKKGKSKKITKKKHSKMELLKNRHFENEGGD